MATQGSGSSKSAAAETMAGAAKRVEAEVRRDAAAEDFNSQIEVLKSEVANLRAQLASSGGTSVDAARKAAAAGMDHLRSQGEIGLEDLRANANQIEGQLVDAVREKPVTAMACALGAGFLLALLTRR